MPRCKECDRDFRYNHEVGYSAVICSPLCDGVCIGRNKTAIRCKEIAQQHYLSKNQAVDIDRKISEEFSV